MKKKIFFGILFSAILAINVISVSKTDVSDISLVNLMQITKAEAEEGGGSTYTCWNSYTSGISPVRMCPACNLMWFASGTGSTSTCIGS
jgi:hypothetical protein